MAAYIPIVFPAAYALDVKGVRFGLCIGALLTTAGAWVRYVGTDNYVILLAGQTLSAIAQPFILNAQPMVSARWFPNHQRALATTVASVANPVGVAIGYLIPPIFVSADSDEMALMLKIEAIVVSALCGMLILFFVEAPPTPPSASAEQRALEGDFCTSAQTLARDPNWRLVFAQMMVSNGSFNTLATLVAQLVAPYGYTDDFAGLLGASVVFAGLVGAGIASAIVEQTQCYRHVLIFCFLGGAASLSAFVLNLRSDNEVPLVATMSLFGFFLTPTLPVSFELSCEVTYPMGEALPSGLLMSAGQMSGIALIFGFNSLLEQDLVELVCWLVVGCMLLGGAIMLPFDGKLKRLALDTEKLSINERLRNPADSFAEGAPADSRRLI